MSRQSLVTVKILFKGRVHTIPDAGESVYIIRIQIAHLAWIDRQHWKFHLGRHDRSSREHSRRVRYVRGASGEVGGGGGRNVAVLNASGGVIFNFGALPAGDGGDDGE